MNKFYTSDTHFCHSNIIKFCNRPYENTDDMDIDLINRWNSIVGIDDTVYFLGDFAMNYKKNRLREIFDLLNGEKHLIKGNHDKKDVYSLNWQSQHDSLTVNDSGYKIVLCHYPMRDWNGKFHNAYHFYGHTHGTIPNLPRAADVGVDSWNGYPTTFEQVRARLKEQFKDNEV